ncbi:8514_t:CDS:2 [Funneliformis caledonium]|uniref:8514_t:CDS:1 n=1 Tax=Funneliformis caledonium TaxID=1117310 RepID=A0A9N9D614_9GLOM|nr:8514_t:CDS:2 [Funneliformis caledonium]
MPRCLRSYVFRTTEFEDDVEVEPNMVLQQTGMETSGSPAKLMMCRYEEIVLVLVYISK